ncbi:QueT transporter family protein [Clostridium sp. 19966]|uniref:QueT transporter family protein n=1 Tax=Clostridium sp. 19966 TaxID=2768166 RepID=UPI0028DD59B1|nr:QueT transporter family protein [Clostridium sp. 19966]MDT8716555.1 QueT transporter family protein [Clostridium sp. 19966]
MKFSTHQMARGALIAALYAVLTLFFTYTSYSNIQYRFAEAFTILPMLSPCYAVGVTLGCFIANLWSPNGITDLIFGTGATLIASLITYFIGKSNIKFKKFIAPIPPVLVNAVIVALVLKYSLGLPFWLSALQVGWGEFICAYVLGILLMTFIEKNPKLKKLFL